jgi:uncharacterized protein YndB with AHSA1/START domain
MTVDNQTRVVKSFAEKSVLVSREFEAPLALVWRAYTESELLDQWWGPAPWRAETKRMNFTVGGHWLYAMVGPNSERHWGRMNYVAIDPHRSITLEDVFCDADGNVDDSMPKSKGQMIFTATASGTRVDFKTHYASEAELQKIIEMGFEQGITVCNEQLALLLKARAK